MRDQGQIDRRTALVAAFAALILPTLASATPASELSELFRVHSDAAANDGRKDFDFLHGRWTVAHRSRKALDPDAPWQDFVGVVECRPLVGGLINIVDNILHKPTGSYRAATVRVFDPAKKQWSIEWIDERAPSIDANTVQGEFKDGVGLFYADDPTMKPTGRIRFKWWRVTPTSARWEQALSTDKGATWIDNWFMDFSRVA